MVLKKDGNREAQEGFAVAALKSEVGHVGVTWIMKSLHVLCGPLRFKQTLLVIDNEKIQMSLFIMEVYNYMAHPD